MTDLEGVCGVVDHDDWVMRESRHYDEARALLAQEVNAAVQGFFEAGATDVLVADAHGAGGIDQGLLDPRSRYQRGFVGPWPFGLDDGFDAIAWVGQHAKAGTPYAHIPHTQWFNVLDWRINGLSVGELGQLAFCAALLGVHPIFASGDEALVTEARALVPGIECVAVKKGLTPGSGDELDCGEYRTRNGAAIHLHPQKARELIRSGARTALRRFRHSPDTFAMPDVKPPFRVEVRYRPNGPTPAYTAFSEHPSDLAACMNAPFSRREGE
jgi:D-amino peptidase